MSDRPPACVAGAPSGAGRIRRFEAADGPAVGRLAQRIFIHSDRPPPPAFGAHFAELFLDGPWSDPAMPSHVFLDGKDAVRGFVGVLSLPMTFEGRAVRGAVASSIMVDGAEANPTAGARLLRAALGGAQELTIGENVTPAARGLWEALGARPALLNGLAWMRVLRPAGLALDLAARKLPGGALLRAAGAGLDALAQPLLRRLRPVADSVGRDVAPEDLAPIVQDAIAAWPLRPDWDDATLRRMLAVAARKRRFGAPVARIVEARGRVAGGWLGHVAPRGALRVMQAFTLPGRAEAVVDDILAEAWRRGAVVAMGRDQPELTEPLQLRGALFRGTGLTLVHTRDRALAAAVRRHEAFLNGLAGESWARINGDSFD